VVFVAGVLLLAVAIGFAAGGRLSGLATLRIEWAPLAVAGVALQFLPESGPWSFALLVASFILLAAAVVKNLAIPGFALILVGLSMNLAVIALNHGMPVTERALVASGQQATLGDLMEDGGAKHHLASGGDRLLVLGDVTPIPPPVSQIVSAGDVVAYAGLGYVIVAAMRRARGAAVPPVLERIPIGAGPGEGRDG
jgi:hypothetical protein